MTPYRYDGYALASQTVTGKNMDEVRNTPDVVKDWAVEFLGKNALQEYAGRALERALEFERMINRYYFLEDEVKYGVTYMTMSMSMQTLALTVLLSHLAGKANLSVLFSGCGLGDWAAAAALALGGSSQVWCVNMGRGITDQSMGYFMRTRLADMFDLKLAPLLAAEEVHRGIRLRWACLEPDSGSCIGPNDFDPLLTYNVDAISAELGVRELDAVVFGNAIKPRELIPIRNALKKEGFALVPVCSSYAETSTEGRANSYCKGFWWQLGKEDGGDAPGPRDRKLWRYSSTMRPIGADGDPLLEEVRNEWEA